jgi:hypothetical protein
MGVAMEPALLILTLMAGGDTRLTLTPAETAADCEASREVVTQILTEAGNPPLIAICGETALRLSPFEHGAPPEAEVHRYQVDLPAAGGFVVLPLAKAAACVPAPDGSRHCARSAQAVLGNG